MLGNSTFIKYYNNLTFGCSKPFASTAPSFEDTILIIDNIRLNSAPQHIFLDNRQKTEFRIQESGARIQEAEIRRRRTAPLRLNYPHSYFPFASESRSTGYFFHCAGHQSLEVIHFLYINLIIMLYS